MILKNYTGTDLSKAAIWDKFGEQHQQAPKYQKSTTSQIRTFWFKIRCRFNANFSLGYASRLYL